MVIKILIICLFMIYLKFWEILLIFLFLLLLVVMFLFKVFFINEFYFVEILLLFDFKTFEVLSGIIF